MSTTASDPRFEAGYIPKLKALGKLKSPDAQLAYFEKLDDIDLVQTLFLIFDVIRSFSKLGGAPEQVLDLMNLEGAALQIAFGRFAEEAFVPAFSAHLHIWESICEADDA